jgi:translation initiation factor IF-1
LVCVRNKGKVKGKVKVKVKVKGKVKVKVTPEQTTKAQRHITGVALPFL